MWTEQVTAVGSIATAIGVLVAVAQFGLARRQAKTTFEGQLVDQYRDIIAGIPVSAMLGAKLDGEEWRLALPYLFRYLDLCNEQIFLHDQRRIRKETWKEWEPGLLANFDRQAFWDAWVHIDGEIRKNDHQDFEQLRALLKEKNVAARHAARAATREAEA